MKWIGAGRHSVRGPLDRPSSERLTAFLLGELDASEATALEDTSFDDEAVFEELQATEAELFDAYLHRRLPAARRARFEARFLTSPEGHARLATARALSDRATPSRPRPSLLEQLRTWLGAGGPRLLAVAAALLAVITSGVLLLRGSGPRTGEPIIEATLHPLALRAEGTAPRIEVPPAASLKLELALHEARPAASYVAVLSRSGAPVWQSGDLTGDGLRVFVRLPAAALQPGGHQLLLRSAGEDHRTVAEYRFEVMTPE